MGHDDGTRFEMVVQQLLKALEALGSPEALALHLRIRELCEKRKLAIRRVGDAQRERDDAAKALNDCRNLLARMSGQASRILVSHGAAAPGPEATFEELDPRLDELGETHEEATSVWCCLDSLNNARMSLQQLTSALRQAHTGADRAWHDLRTELQHAMEQAGALTGNPI